MTRTSFNRAALAVAFLFSLSIGQLRAELPPDAQEAMKKGLQATKQAEWEIAIQSFQEARKTAPEAPEVFYNLGLAESKIPGRELRAIAWFGAYLAAAPGAPNAAAVKDEIAALQIKNEGNTRRLIKTVQDSAQQIPTETQRYISLGKVAALWAASGDSATAQATLALIRDSNFKDSAEIDVAEAQTQAGDILGAQKTAGLITNAENKSRAAVTIANAQVNAGDIAGAQKTAEGITTRTGWKSDMEIEIGKAQRTTGDIAGAQRTLRLAEKSAELMNDDGYHMSLEESNVAEAQAEAGDIAGAQATILIAQKFAALIKKGDAKVIGVVPGATDEGLRSTARGDIAEAQAEVAEAQAKAGDLAGAQATILIAQKSAAPIKKGDPTVNLVAIAQAQAWVAIAQAQAGDIIHAKKTAALITSANERERAERAIAYEQAHPRAIATPSASGSSRAAVAASATPSGATLVEAPAQRVIPVKTSDYLGNLDSQYSYSDCALNTPVFLDLAGYLKTLPTADDPQSAFENLRATAEKIIKARNVIDGMLKRQAKQQTEQGKK